MNRDGYYRQASGVSSLNSRQIRELSFSDDKTGRITRRRLNKLVHAEYIRRRRMQTVAMNILSRPRRGQEIAWVSRTAEDWKAQGTYRGIVASVFRNEADNGTPFHKVTIARTYKDGDQFKSTSSFSRDDLPLVTQISNDAWRWICLLYTSPSPRDATLSRMPSSA